MLGSVVQVHLSPPTTRFRKYSNVQTPALLTMRTRVFCTPRTRNIRGHPKQVLVFLLDIRSFSRSVFAARTCRPKTMADEIQPIRQGIEPCVRHLPRYVTIGCSKRMSHRAPTHRRWHGPGRTQAGTSPAQTRTSQPKSSRQEARAARHHRPEQVSIPEPAQFIAQLEIIRSPGLP